VRPLWVRRLGRVGYAEGLALMAALRTARLAGDIEDTLLLLEHPAVITMGRKGSPDHIRASQAELGSLGIEVFETERGGDVTYHGSGQVVGYPILNLAPDRCDVRRYVRDLEEAMIRTASDFGVAAGRVTKLNGIWLGEGADPPSPGPSRKLGAVGVHLSRWITSHGFAFNASTDLAAFDLIVPCGISGRGVTSLRSELGHPVDQEEVESRLASHLADLLGRELRHWTPVVRAETEAAEHLVG
jgi:lipoyl(octanoyl) transferase